METMLVRMARVIYPDVFARMDQQRKDFPADPYERFLETPAVAACLSRTKAALTAIMEPSEEIMGIDCDLGPSHRSGQWRTMVQAIIEGRV